MAAFMIPGGWEIWAIVAVVVLLFGPTQIPKLAKMFGKSAKALKEGMDEASTEFKAATGPDADKPADTAKPAEEDKKPETSPTDPS